MAQRSDGEMQCMTSEQQATWIMSGIYEFAQDREAWYQVCSKNCLWHYRSFALPASWEQSRGCIVTAVQ